MANIRGNYLIIVAAVALVLLPLIALAQINKVGDCVGGDCMSGSLGADGNLLQAKNETWNLSDTGIFTGSAFNSTCTTGGATACVNSYVNETLTVQCDAGDFWEGLNNSRFVRCENDIRYDMAVKRNLPFNLYDANGITARFHRSVYYVTNDMRILNVRCEAVDGAAVTINFAVDTGCDSTGADYPVLNAIGTNNPVDLACGVPGTMTSGSPADVSNGTAVVGDCLDLEIATVGAGPTTDIAIHVEYYDGRE